MTLEQALSVPCITAHVESDGATFDIWWTSDEIEPGGIVDFQHPDSVAEATIHQGEWTRLLISPAARRHGIYTAIMAVPEAVYRNEGLWPQWIHVSANELDFYLSSGWEEDAERPGYVRKMQDRTEAWLSR